MLERLLLFLARDRDVELHLVALGLCVLRSRGCGTATLRDAFGLGLEIFDAAERLRGYHAALKEAGIEPESALERCGDFTEAGGYDAAIELLAETNRPTAVFAANDSMAIGALSAFRESGIKVPGDIAVAGFDDIPLARYMDPPLSSVRVPISDLGATAVDILLHAITHKNLHTRRRERVSTEVVIRRSTNGQPAERPPPQTFNREIASV